MAGLLRPDSPFHRAWSSAADLVVINVLTIVACLPVLTAGAALSACARVTMEMARDEDTYTVRTWWRCLRGALPQSLAWWLPTLLLSALTGGLYAAVTRAGGVPAVLGGLLAAGGLIIVAVLVWLIPLVAFFDNSTAAHVSNAARLALGHLGRTTACLAVVLAPAVFAYALPEGRAALAWFTAIIGPGFAGYLMALIQRRVIDQLRDAAR